MNTLFLNDRLVDACKRGNISRIQKLITAGADPTIQTKIGIPLLHWAASKGKTEVCKALVECGLDVDEVREVEKTKCTPVALAACKGHALCVSALIELGADPNGKNASGFTPLIWAAAHGHTPALQALIERGARIDDKDSQNRSALYWSVYSIQREATVFLMQSGASLEGKCTHGQAIRDVAVNGGSSLVQIIHAWELKKASMKAIAEILNEKQPSFVVK